MLLHAKGEFEKSSLALDEARNLSATFSGTGLNLSLPCKIEENSLLSCAANFTHTSGPGPILGSTAII